MKSVVMRRQQMLAKVIPIPMLLALLLLISHYAACVHAMEHRCIQDTDAIQKALYGAGDKESGLREVFTTEGMEKRIDAQKYATEIGNIRIVHSTADLDDKTKYCTSKDQIVSDFLTPGGVFTCDSDDILTEKKREILLKNVLPAAVDMLSSALKVKRVKGNLITRGCSEYNVPESHKSTGVPNADYVLYVSAVEADGGAMAWGGMCMFDEAYRPVAGKMNFSPVYLDDKDTNAQRRLVRTAVHEILHGIGFSSSFWIKHFPAGQISFASETRRGKTVKYFGTVKVVEKAKAHFDCKTLKGPEIEDEFDSFDIKAGISHVGSHWKRRNHKDDIMAMIGSRMMYLSPITLAVLEDSGHYMIDWSKAEDPEWMYKAGCEMITSKCNTAAGGLGKYFCKDETATHICTLDHRSIGGCGIETFVDALPSWAQYFPKQPLKGGEAPLMDYCPIVNSYYDTQCDNPANPKSNDTNIGRYYANDGRCFKTNGVIKSGYSYQPLRPVSCLQTRCVRKVVEFKMPSHDDWIACPSKGTEVTLSKYGYDGTVICPDPNIICDAVEIKKKETNTPTTAKSATAISSTIPAVLISSVVFAYLSHR